MKIKGIQTEKGKLGEKERLVQDVVMGEQKMSSDSDSEGGGEESEGLIDGDSIANGVGQCRRKAQLASRTTSRLSPVLCSLIAPYVSD